MEEIVNISEKTCKNCSQRIPSDAKKCHLCQTWQSWYYWLHDILNIVQVLSLLGTLLMAWFTFNQAKEAGLALKDIHVIENKVQDARKEIQITDANLKLVVKAAVENEFILASSSFLPMGESRARERLEKNLDILTGFIENDKTESEKWWETLHDLFKERNREAEK